MSTDLVAISVPGTDREVMATLVDGQPMVSLRHVCEAIGLAVDPQRRKLRSRSWAVVTQEVSTGSDGKSYEMTMIDRRTFTMWLGGMDENRVNDAARPVLIAFQAQAADALDAYFNRRAVVAPPMNQLDVLRAALDQIEAVQRDAAEARALAQRTEARLDGIEGRHDWFSALGYAKTKGLPTYTKFLARVGKHTAMIARAHGIEPDKTQHPHFGTVNSFPIWIWDLAAEGFDA